MKTREIWLGSSGLIHAPGIWAWARNGYRFKRDRAAIARVIIEGWRVNPNIARQALAGKLPVRIEEDAVVITVPLEVGHAMG